MIRHALLLAAGLLAASPALAGSPWISVELPANRIDPETRGAYLVVRTYYHATPAQLLMRGTAEGVVNGQRRSVPLSYRPTSHTGVYALERNWDAEGVWVLDIRAFNGTFEMSAVVGVGPEGEAVFVRVPLARTGAPRAVSSSELSGMLASLAEGRAPPPLQAAGFGLAREGQIRFALQAAALLGTITLLVLGLNLLVRGLRFAWRRLASARA
jgi:hypothetical protein